MSAFMLGALIGFGLSAASFAVGAWIGAQIDRVRNRRTP